jgi:hypothetical protein
MATREELPEWFIDALRASPPIPPTRHYVFIGVAGSPHKIGYLDPPPCEFKNQFTCSRSNAREGQVLQFNIPRMSKDLRVYLR